MGEVKSQRGKGSEISVIYSLDRVISVSSDIIVIKLIHSIVHATITNNSNRQSHTFLPPTESICDSYVCCLSDAADE